MKEMPVRLVPGPHGRDPANQKRTDRAAQTFGDLVDAYLKREKLPSPIGTRSWPQYERALTKEFLPVWKNRAARSARNVGTSHRRDRSCDRRIESAPVLALSLSLNRHRSREREFRDVFRARFIVPNAPGRLSDFRALYRGWVMEDDERARWAEADPARELVSDGDRKWARAYRVDNGALRPDITVLRAKRDRSRCYWSGSRANSDRCCCRRRSRTVPA